MRYECASVLARFMLGRPEAFVRILMVLSKALRTDGRVVREAHALQEAGHTVEVLEWGRHEPSAPSRETLHGIQVTRLHLAWIERRLPTVLQMLRWWRAATRRAQLNMERPDVVHCHDLDTLPIGVRLKERLGSDLVFDAHEHYPSMVAGSRGRGMAAVARRLERRLLPSVDLVVAAGDRFAAIYKESFSGPVVMVLNAVDPVSGPSEKHKGFTAVYIGTLTHDRLFPDLVAAFCGGSVNLVVGGKREGVYEKTRRAAQCQGVTFLGPVPQEDVVPETARCHTCLIPLDPDNPQFRVQLANKLFESIACGVPIVATAGTASGDFVERHGIGAVVPYDTRAFVEAVHQLALDPERWNAMVARTRELAGGGLGWQEQVTRLHKGYAQLPGWQRRDESAP